MTCFHEFSKYESTNFFTNIPKLKKVNHNKYSLQKLVDSEFKIGETIWWIWCKNSNSNSTLFQIFKGSGDDCKALCRKTPGCSGYTYVGDENPKYCYLNSDKGKYNLFFVLLRKAELYH